MEDAATAEISRSQLWQWLHVGGLHLDDGTAIDFALFDACMRQLPALLGERALLPGGNRLDDAIALLDTLTRSEDLAEFLTLPAYQMID
jgi:malate synthase